MPKLKVLLLTAFLLVAPFCYSAGTTERHLLEQCISYEDLGTAIRYGQSWVDYPGYADRKAWEERVAPEMKEIIIRNGEKALTHIWKPILLRTIWLSSAPERYVRDAPTTGLYRH